METANKQMEVANKQQVEASQLELQIQKQLLVTQAAQQELLTNGPKNPIR